MTLGNNNRNDWRTSFFHSAAIAVIISAVVVDVVFVLSLFNWEPLHGVLA
jgi:hypothetical protein